MQGTSKTRAVTMVDVARRAGTSTAVVSYVINDGPRPVAASTRRRVETAAAELGYRPNRLAGALRSRTSGVVGLVLPDASNPYFSGLARQIEQALQETGKLTLIGNAGYAASRQLDLVERFLAAQVDGLIVVAADGNTDLAAGAARAGVPRVYVHHRPTAASAPVICADNQGSVQRAIAHLRAHGHRRIAFLAGPDDSGPVGSRRQAWQDGKAGGDLLRSPYTRSGAASLITRLAAERSVPRALITGTDEQAIGVLAGAFAAGIAVPDQLAVISLDGTPDSAFTAPALTVTEQRLADMARLAVHHLTGSSIVAPPPQQAPLVIRRSCGCPPSDAPQPD